jgi:hypothetical protein
LYLREYKDNLDLIAYWRFMGGGIQ